MASEWKILTNWKNPISERIEHIVVYGDILITHYLKEISFWNIRNGLDKPEFIVKLNCENVENLRIFESRLYVFGYYSIEVIEIADVHSIRKIDVIQFDRNLVIGGHSMQSFCHVQRCGALVNGELLFSFFNGIARMQNGIVTMVADIEYKGFKTEYKDVLFHDNHLYVVGRGTGLCNFEITGNEVKLRQTIKKGYTPTSLVFHQGSSTLILFGNEDFVTFDISNPQNIVRNNAIKTNSELCRQVAISNNQYLCVGWTKSNKKIQLSTLEIEEDGPKFVAKQELRDYPVKESSNSDSIHGVVVKDNLMLVHTYYRGFGLFELC